ncbi:hypothetical protein ACWOKN_004305 [Vibrio vulnificus]|nr:hypothetical protein [Vibrio vulnificus]
MANFLRDELLKNITIDEELLIQLSQELHVCVGELNQEIRTAYYNTHEFQQKIKAEEELVENNSGRPFVEPYIPKYRVSYIIRFDNKGYIVDTIEDLVNYFKTSKNVERLIMQIKPEVDNQVIGVSSRVNNCFIEFKVDTINPYNCSFSVTGDDKGWVTANYSSFKDLIGNKYNRAILKHSPFVDIFLASCLNLFGLLLSLVTASVIKPFFDDSLILSFIVVLFVFLSIQPIISQGFFFLLNKFRSNITIKNKNNKETLDWLVKAVVGTVASGVIIYYFSKFGKFILGILKNIQV